MESALRFLMFSANSCASSIVANSASSSLPVHGNCRTCPDFKTTRSSAFPPKAGSPLPLYSAIFMLSGRLPHAFFMSLGSNPGSPNRGFFVAFISSFPELASGRRTGPTGEWSPRAEGLKMTKTGLMERLAMLLYGQHIGLSQSGVILGAAAPGMQAFRPTGKALQWQSTRQRKATCPCG